MYLDFWKLKERPFENTPDCRFLYPSQNHRDALQRVLYAVTGEKGCAMLSGEYGCGKTVLVRTVVNQLDPEKYEIALINYPVFTRESFLKDIMFQFGLEASGSSPTSLFRELTQFLYETTCGGRRALLVIDEAQIMDDSKVFEQLRLLLNTQLEDRFLVNVLLVGQSELREKIMLYPRLDQQIAVKCHLHRFDFADTADYVRHRLRVAGTQNPVFTDEALYLVHKISNGVPRRINNVADLCLLEAYRREATQVESDVFRFIM